MSLSYLDCVDFALIHKIGGTLVSLPGKTKLDKERRNQCLTEIVRFSILIMANGLTS